MSKTNGAQGLERTSLPLWQRAALLCLGYFTCAWLGSFLSPSGGPSVSYWLPGGLFVAVLLVNPTRDWPWLMLSILPANIGFDLWHDKQWDFLLIGSFCVANVLQAGTGAWLVRQFIAQKPSLSSLREFSGLLFFTGVAAAAVGATIAATVLTRLHLVPSFVESWKVLWGGNVMAVLVVSPLVLAFADGRTRMPSSWKLLRLTEAVLVFGGMVAFLWFVLVEGRGIGSPKVPVLVFVLWAGLRFGLRGASVMVFTLAVLAAFLTTHYQRGLAFDEIASGSYIFTLQVFVAVAAMVGLVPTIVIAERDRATLKLRESESRFRSLTEAAFEGIFISEDGRLLDVSDQGLKMFGYERGEMVGKPVVEVVSPVSRAEVAEAIRTSSEQIYGHELLRKDGGTFYGEARSRYVRVDGRILRMTALRDITERRLAEQSLRESEEKFSKLFLSSPDAMSLSDLAAGRFIEVNDSFTKVYGYNREEIIGRSSVELGMWPDPATRDAMIKRLETGSIRDYAGRGRKRSGEIFPNLCSAEKVYIKGRACIVTVIRDMTSQVRAETALRESEEKFSKAFRTGPDVMSITDFETGNYIEVNVAHEKTFGFTREEVVGRSPLELGIFPHPSISADLRKELKERGQIHNVEIEARTRDGRKLMLLHSAELIELGGRQCVLRVSHDITERKLAEELNRLQSQVLQMIANGRPLAETLDTLLRMIEAQAEGMHTSILLLDPDRVHLHSRAAPTLPPDYVKATESFPLGPAVGCCGTAAFRREAVYVEDIATDPLWDSFRQLVLPHGLLACWSTPIFDPQKNVLGTFAIYYRRKQKPDPQHLRLIQMATHTAAICLLKQRAETENRLSIEREQKARIQYTFQLIAAQEAERKRIASELHDSLGQNLLLIKNLAQMTLREQEPAPTYERVASINHLATQCIAETRQISHDLHPPQLDHLGLTRALEAMIENAASASHIRFTQKLDPVDDVFSAEAAVNFYRILQESLNNILKHASAKNVDVRVEQDIHEVQLLITDDGCGFTPEKSDAARKGLGLKNITERVRMLGGKLKIDSAPGRGTRIEVTVPIAGEAA